MAKKSLDTDSSVQNEYGAFALGEGADTGADAAPPSADTDASADASRRVATRRAKKDDDAVASVASVVLADSGADGGAQGAQNPDTAPVVEATAPFSYVEDAAAISIDLTTSFMDADAGQTLTYTIASFNANTSDSTAAVTESAALAAALTAAGLSFDGNTGMLTGTLASKANYAITVQATDNHATPKSVDHTFSLTATDFYDYSSQSGIVGHAGSVEIDKIQPDGANDTSGNIFYLREGSDRAKSLSNEGAGLVDTIIVRGNLAGTDFSYDDIAVEESVEFYGLTAGDRNFELGVDRLVFLVTGIDNSASTPLTDARRNTILDDFIFRVNRGTVDDGRVTLEVVIMEAAQPTTLRLIDALIANEEAAFMDIDTTNSADSGYVIFDNNADILDLFGVGNFAIVHHSDFVAPKAVPLAKSVEEIHTLATPGSALETFILALRNANASEESVNIDFAKATLRAMFIGVEDAGDVEEYQLSIGETILMQSDLSGSNGNDTRITIPVLGDRSDGLLNIRAGDAGDGTFNSIGSVELKISNPLPMAKSATEIETLAATDTALEAFINALINVPAAGGTVSVTTAPLGTMFTGFSFPEDPTSFGFTIGGTKLTAMPNDIGGFSITIPALADIGDRILTIRAGDVGFSNVLNGIGSVELTIGNPLAPMPLSDAAIAALATSGSALEIFITALAGMAKEGGDVVVSTATLAMLFTNLDPASDSYSFAIGGDSLTAPEADDMVTITIPALAMRDVGSISISASDNSGSNGGDVKFAIGDQYDFTTGFDFRLGTDATDAVSLVSSTMKSAIYSRGGTDTYTLAADTYEDVILLDVSVVETLNDMGGAELSLIIDDIPANGRERLDGFQAGIDRIVFRVRSVDGDPTASLTEAQIANYFNLLTFEVLSGRYDVGTRNDDRDGLNIIINVGNPGGSPIPRELSFSDFFSAYKTNAVHQASVAALTSGTNAENQASIEALFGGARYFSFVGNDDIMLPDSTNDAPEFVATDEEAVIAGAIGADIADIDINDLFKDFDNDDITYTIKSVNGTPVTAMGGTHLFNGITFTEATGIFSTDTAGPTAAATHVVVITASDGTLEVDGTITIKIRTSLGTVTPDPAVMIPAVDLTVDDALASQGKSGGFVYNDPTMTDDDIRFYIARGGDPASGVTDMREFVLIDANGFTFEGEWGTLSLGEPTANGTLEWSYLAKTQAHTAARSESFTIRTTDERVIDHADSTTYAAEQYITIALAMSTSPILTNTPEGTEIVVPLVPAASDTGASPEGYKITGGGNNPVSGAQVIVADQAPDVLIASEHGDRIDAGRGIDEINLAAATASDTVYYTIDATGSSWVAYDGADTINSFERGIDTLALALRVPNVIAASSVHNADGAAREMYYNNNAGIKGVDLRPIYSVDGAMVEGIELGFGVSGSSYGGISTGNVLTINFADPLLATAAYDGFAAMGLAEVLGSTESGAMDVFDVNFEVVAANNVAVARSGFIDAFAVARVGVGISVDVNQISDADGLSEALADEANNFSYQWVRLDSVGLGVDIASFALMDDSGFGGSGAGGAREVADADGVYTPDAVNIGDFIRVIVSFRDDAGNAESVSSDAVRIIPAAVSASALDFYESDSAPAFNDDAALPLDIL